MTVYNATLYDDSAGFGRFPYISAVNTQNSDPDSIDPVITLVSPPNGSQLGVTDTITIDITDETSMRDVWIYVAMGGEREVIWGGNLEGFSPRYSTSVKTTITNGFRYAIKRQGGWYAAPIFHCTAIDRGGNQA